MASKYESYWQSKIQDIKRLLGEAYANGTSSELDISGIQSYGQRNSWHGVVDVFRDHIGKGETAHARSLGNVVASTGYLDWADCLGFRMVISNMLTLDATRLDGTARLAPGRGATPCPACAGSGKMEMDVTGFGGEDLETRRTGRKPKSREVFAFPCIECDGTGLVAEEDHQEDPHPAGPGSESSPLSAASDGSLWRSALAKPLPLFRTAPDDPLLAVFDGKGFFVSDEAHPVFDAIKSLPHIYAARLESENAYYFGVSNQSGGRWKRQHAYHLGGLAYEILGTKRYDDQDHSRWVAAWFTPFAGTRRGSQYVIPMKEKVVVSFLVPEPLASKPQLEAAESRLIAMARGRGLGVLNKRS
jgi:hypothetical protein